MNSLIKLAFLLFITTLSFVGVLAQNTGEVESEILLPAQEEFQEVDALAVPWRSSGCQISVDKALREPDCHLVTGKEWTSSDVLTLYNEDGSPWYRFSVNPKSSDYFGRNTKIGFVPFATYPLYGDTVILRMVGESPHWYKVEVNEETRKTKFVLKSDPVWAKTKWSYWLAQIKFFKFDENQQPLLDKPDGQIIEESSGLKFDKVRFLKAEGDWAYVEGGTFQKTYKGWIRWRKGRNMLVNDRFGVVLFQKPK